MASLALALVLLATLLLDPRGMDPATAKLPVLTLGVGLLALASARHPRPPPAAPVDMLVLAWLAWLLVSAALAPYPARRDLGLTLALLPVAAFWFARRELTPAQVARGLAVLAGVAAASQAFELVAAPPWAQGPMGAPANELVGCMANPNRTASLVLLGAPALLGIAGPGALALVAVALVGSLSRGAWLGALAAALGSAWLGERRPSLGGLALAGALAGGLLLSGRLHPEQVLRVRTVQSRLELADIFVDAAGRRPLTGWGPRAGGVAYGVLARERGRPEVLSDREDFAHNPLLQRATEEGVPGLLLALALLATWLRAARLGENEARWVALGLLGAGVAELFSVGLEGPLMRVLVGGAAGAAIPRLDDAPAPSPVAALLGAWLLVLTPGALALSGAEYQRRQARGLGGDGVSKILAKDVADRARSPELRYDSAGQLALSRELGLARARYLVLEARSPGYGSSEDTRRSIREYLGERAAPAVVGPAPPP
jgi:hypothetical protein